MHELPEMPDRDVYRGRDELRRWAETNLEHAGEWKWQLLEVLHEDSGQLVARCNVSVRGVGSGVPVEMVIFHVAELRDGKLAVIRGFSSEGAAREAAGIGL